MEENIQRKVIEIRILEEQIKQLENQMVLVDREILEATSMQSDLDEIKNLKQSEIIVPIGKSVFIKSKIDSGEKVLVDLGSKIVVKKDIDGAKKILERQKNKMLEAKERINVDAERIIEQINKIDQEIMQLQKK